MHQAHDGRWRSGTHGGIIKILFALPFDCFVAQRRCEKLKDAVKLTCESIWKLFVRCFFSARSLITLTWWFGLSSLLGEVYKLSVMKWKFKNQITEKTKFNKNKNFNQAVNCRLSTLDIFGDILNIFRLIYPPDEGMMDWRHVIPSEKTENLNFRTRYILNEYLRTWKVSKMQANFTFCIVSLYVSSHFTQYFSKHLFRSTRETMWGFQKEIDVKCENVLVGVLYKVLAKLPFSSPLALFTKSQRQNVLIFNAVTLEHPPVLNKKWM